MQRTLLPLTLLVCAVAAAASEPYQPYQGIEQGRDGLPRLVFVADNHAAEPIVCSVSLAHWYSAELGHAAPGGAVRAALWLDPATGAVSLLNETAHRMPVEVLWCGFDGRAWATRSRIELPREPAEAEFAVTCKEGADRLVCSSPDKHR